MIWNLVQTCKLEPCHKVACMFNPDIKVNPRLNQIDWNDDEGEAKIKSNLPYLVLEKQVLLYALK